MLFGAADPAQAEGHNSDEANAVHGENAAEGGHHADQVDFPVMKDHLIGRNKFEIPNPFHVTHPIEIYVPIWIVPDVDVIKTVNGHEFTGIILSEDEHSVTIDRINETEYGKKYIEKEIVLRKNIRDIRDMRNVDLSLYKQVIMMWFVALVLILFLQGAGRSASLRPSGKRQNLVEIFVLFFRDDVIYANMGKKQGRRFAPLILTLFFFILLSNLFGLIPGTTTATGSVSVTAGLAVVTFLATQLSGNKDYWRHIFATPGVPLWLLPIMIPVEILGMFTKPFALTIRLFANMTAGHIIILAFLGMIINFKSGWIALGAVPMSIAIYFLEIFVAFLQAYIFALLSSIFIGAAVEEHH